MRFAYCPHCGSKTEPRETGDEGLVPWCPRCGIPLFPLFPTAIIALAVDENGDVALLRQGYISTRHHILVSGYMKPGESAEMCAVREVGEELGLEVSALVMTGTYWFRAKEMLMVGFLAKVRRQDFRLSGEVDQAVWVHPEEAPPLLNAYPAISYLVTQYYLEHRDALQWRPAPKNEEEVP